MPWLWNSSTEAWLIDFADAHPSFNLSETCCSSIFMKFMILLMCYDVNKRNCGCIKCVWKSRNAYDNSCTLRCSETSILWKSWYSLTLLETLWECCVLFLASDQLICVYILHLDDLWKDARRIFQLFNVIFFMKHELSRLPHFPMVEQTDKTFSMSDQI